MFKRLAAGSAALLVSCSLLATSAGAGVVVYEDGDKKVEIGGRVQLQYLLEDPEDGDSSDDLFFRRLRPYITGSVTKDWSGKFQFDFGKADGSNEVAVKDAYMQYKGWNNLKLTIGNSKTPFSREFLTSSKRQQTVERGFVGDHNFGTPDRQLGFKLEGQNDSKKVTWALAVGGQQHDPDAKKMDFDTPANNSSDWNDGWVVGGRVDFHPNGFMKFDQGDFRSDKVLYNFSLAGFSWTNDDDNNTFIDVATGLNTSSSKADLDSANGFEVSAGLRGKGVSVDAEYQMVSGDTVDPTFTGGLYRNGTTDLDKLHIEGGVMLPNKKVELVGKWQSLDADNYDTSWDVTEFGFNYFWNKHKVKVQFTYRSEDNVNGVQDENEDKFFMQWQYVF